MFRDCPSRELQKLRLLTFKVDQIPLGSSLLISTFSYLRIIFVLGKEYPELDLSKLKSGEDAYICEQDAKGQQQKDLTLGAEFAPARPEEIAPSDEQGS